MEASNLALIIGYIVLVCGSAALIFLFLYGLCILSNRLQHAIAETMGGWKVLMEFRDWHRNFRPKGEE